MRPPLIGIDLLEPDRLADRLTAHPDLQKALFTEGEIAYCRRQPRPIEHFSARFSAKEAVVKALGIDGFDPREVEVISGGESTDVRLHGDVERKAIELGVTVTISMTHLSSVVGAVALATPVPR